LTAVNLRVGSESLRFLTVSLNLLEGFVHPPIGRVVAIIDRKIGPLAARNVIFFDFNGCGFFNLDCSSGHRSGHYSHVARS
jgi:hypothetical protein